MKNISFKVFLISLIFASPLTIQASEGFAITSDDFKNGDVWSKELVFKGFGCEGKNLSPQLAWVNAPEGTKSFAITIHDPDAPTTSGWWHWLVYNISANVSSIEQGASKTAKNTLPKASQEAFTDYGSTGFGGACPPKGDKPHNYNVTLYALKTEALELDPATTSGAKLTYMLNLNSLAKAKISGTYGR